MIDTEFNAGTACAYCRKLGHFCSAKIAFNAIPLCLSCYDELPCEAQVAHRIRITGLGGEETGNLSGPVKQLPVDHSETMRVEFKSAWRMESERRRLDAEKAPSKPKPSEEILAARRERRRIMRAAANKRMYETKRSRSGYVPTLKLDCACGRKMRPSNKYGVCWICADKKKMFRNSQPVKICACGKKIRTGLDKCIACRRAKKPAKLCSKCPAPLLTSNKTGLCVKHYVEWKYGGDKPKACKECQRRIYRDNVLGMCKKCSQPYYTKQWRERKKAQRLSEAA